MAVSLGGDDDDEFAVAAKPQRGKAVALMNRVFVAFANEDQVCRDRLEAQAKEKRSRFDFVDISEEEPWKQDWQNRVRSRIRGCDGVIALLSPHTYRDPGERYEMQCANEEHVPLIGLQVTAGQSLQLPPELVGKPFIEQTWDGIVRWLNSL